MGYAQNFYLGTQDEWNIYKNIFDMGVNDFGAKCRFIQIFQTQLKKVGCLVVDHLLTT